MNSEQRELLLDGYLQGNLDDAGFRQLLELLRKDSTAVKRLVELSLLESQLTLMGQEEGLLHDAQIGQLMEETDEFSLNILDDLAPQTEGTETREVIRQRADRQLRKFLAEQERLRREQRLITQRSSTDIRDQLNRYVARMHQTARYTVKLVVGFSVAAAILLLLLAGYQHYRSQRWVAALGKTTDAIWLETPESGPLYPGRLVLQEGYAEILFRSGARTIVEAPSEFQLLSSKRMLLEAGTVTTQVPPQAHGFTVASRTVEVEDLGTEFGVKVGQDGRTETAVFEGLVELTGSNRSQPDKRRVKANQKVFASVQGQLGKTKTLEWYHDFRRSWDDVLYLPRVSGQMRVLRQKPLDVCIDQLESMDWIFVIAEQRNICLEEDLPGVATGSGLIKMEDTEGVLSAGVRVDSYLLHYDPLGDTTTQSSIVGTIQFSRPILGVLCTDSAIFNSNRLLTVPDIRYPDRLKGQGLELNEITTTDRVIIHDDRKSLSVNLHVNGHVMDQMRVLVEAVPVSPSELNSL